MAFDFLSKYGSTPTGVTFPSMYSVLANAGEQVVAAVRKSIIDKKLIASRKLLQGLNFEVKIFGKGYILTVDFSNDEQAQQYAQYVETGRPPGKPPPIEPILKWIASKGIKPKDDALSYSLQQKQKKQTSVLKGFAKRKYKTLTKRRNMSKAVRSLAYAIANRIAKNGTIKRFGYYGSGFWSEVVNDDLKADLKRDLQKALKKDVLVEIKSFTKPS